MKRILLFGAFAFSAFAFQSCKEKGCTDKEALNYNESAQKEDGSCLYKGIELDFEAAPNYFLVVDGIEELRPTGITNPTMYFQERYPYTFADIWQMNNYAYFESFNSGDQPIGIFFTTELDSGYTEIPNLNIADFGPGFYGFAQEITPDENLKKFVISRTVKDKSYSSAFGPQEQSTLEILESSTTNFQGKDGIKMHLRINCKLYNVDDVKEIITLTDTEVTIAIVNEVI